MATRIVLAVIPMSEAGTVLVGVAAGVVDAVDGADDADDAVAVGVVVAVLLLLLPEELHPAIRANAARAAAASAAKRVRLGIPRPVPPRPDDSLLGLMLCPPRLPCRFGMAKDKPNGQ
jgi:hypothetical protein